MSSWPLQVRDCRFFRSKPDMAIALQHPLGDVSGQGPNGLFADVGILRETCDERADARLMLFVLSLRVGRLFFIFFGDRFVVGSGFCSCNSGRD